MSKAKGVHIMGIAWDFYDEDMDEDGVLLNGIAPDNVTIENLDETFGENWDMDDLLYTGLADYLSNTYGYCVYEIGRVEFF